MATETRVKDCRFTLQQTADLFNTQVTVARRELLTKKADERVKYIVKKVESVIGSRLWHYDYFNEDAVGEDGVFKHDHARKSKYISMTVTADPNKYKDKLIDSDLLIKSDPKFLWSQVSGELFIPVSWLHEDFEPVLQKAFDDTGAEHKTLVAQDKKEVASVVSTKPKAKARKLKW